MTAVINHANNTRPSPDWLLGTPKKLLIGGQWLPARSGDTVETIDPTTRQVLTSFAVAGPADVDAAVRAAREAFEDPTWAQLPAYQRSLVLLRIADVIDEHAEELAVLTSLDMGGAIGQSRFFSAHAAETFRYFAGWTTKVHGTTGPSGPGQFNYTQRLPVGVVAGIIGWNGPMLALSWKIAPALAFGNTIVFKPAEDASLSSLRFGELLAEVEGLPPGVVNIVTGSGRTTGEALITHPGVDKVAFTGSTAVGQHILRTSADDLKRVTLELGGKSPTIVFPDADLRAAARMAAAGYLSGTGQGCVMGTRIFVHSSVREEFVALLREESATYTIGDPFAEGTSIGPVASQDQYDKVTSYFDIAREDGANLVLGGTASSDNGFFIEPTLYDGVTNDMRIAQEEIFGPVAAVLSFDTVQEAVRLGNDSQYGLSASVWTKDLGLAHSTAAALRAGTVWINTWAVMTPEMPFGGFKRSGIGRENGASAIEEYTEVQTVIVQLEDAGYAGPSGAV